MANVLVVDDQPSICRALKQLLERDGHSVTTVGTAEAGLANAQRTQPDVVLLDIRLPGMDGLTALPQFKQNAPNAAVIVITGHGTMDTAVQAIQAGAFEYVLKPFSGDAIVGLVRRAVTQPTRSARIDELVAEFAQDPAKADAIGFVGETPAVQEIYKQIGSVAASDATVLIVGETGTGKEVVARAIHRASGREGPFVPVSVATLQPSELELEMFGGAETRSGEGNRATSVHGFLAAAQGGTLFLDEIGELPLETQPKLLRLLEDGEYIRVGDDTPRKTTCRVLCASRHALESLVEAGRFRQELLYRISVTRIDVPPLRERLPDLPTIMAAMLFQLGHKGGVTEDFVARLLAHAWPGNVRELRNALQHATLTARDKNATIDVAHLPAMLHDPAASASIDQVVDNLLAANEGLPEGQLHEAVMDAIEAPLLRKIMGRVAGNQVQAAKVLGIHRGTLKAKLDKYGIDPRDPMP